MTTRWQRTTSRRALRSSAARSLLGLGAAAAATAAAALAGCAADGGDTEAVTGSRPVAPLDEAAEAAPVAAALPGVEELRAAADRWWSAHRDEDWSAMFALEDPEVLGAAVEADYADWQSRNQPFRVHEYAIEQAQVDDARMGRLGWVLVDRTTSVRSIPGAPEVEAESWQKWRVSDDGRWVRISERAAEAYPAPPAERALELEAALADRFMRSWEARVDRNWPLLWRLASPADQADLAFEDFISAHDQILFGEVDVRWVQASPDGRGVVNGVFTTKKNDPHQQKAPFRPVLRAEEWVLVDGTWYMDLPGVGEAADQPSGATR